MHETECSVPVILIDGEAPAEQIETLLKSLPHNVRDLSPAEIVGIMELVSPYKSESDISLPIAWTP